MTSKRVMIIRTENPFAVKHIGQLGTVVGMAPNGVFLRIDLDDGTKDYWADPANVRAMPAPPPPDAQTQDTER